jgi:hypothetical protein
MKVFAAVALTLGLAIASCQKGTDPPPRPAGVPETAFWVGGADGGVFVLLEKEPQEPAHVYRARVYHDHSGELWYSGNLAMVPQDRPSVDVSNPNLFSGWDGDNLHLTDGRRLAVVRQK